MWRRVELPCKYRAAKKGLCFSRMQPPFSRGGFVHIFCATFLSLDVCSFNLQSATPPAVLHFANAKYFNAPYEFQPLM